MTKFLLAILLVFSTCVVVAHGILAYQFNAPQSLIAEEEAPEEKPVSKDSKDFGKDKIVFSSYSYKSAVTNKLLQSCSDHIIKCSKGFFDKPYNPPEVS